VDKYAKKYLKMIKQAKTDEELIGIINKVYENGFEDGCNEGKNTTNDE